jgi:intraflagellar transport protein 56
VNIIPVVFQLLSRAKPASGPATVEEKEKKKKKLPKLEDFVAARDYTGAVTLLEFERANKKSDIQTSMWISYCYFHLGDYKRCLKVTQIC